MNNRILLAATAMTLFFAGCGKKGDDGGTTVQQHKINISASIESATQQSQALLEQNGKGSFEKGDLLLITVSAPELTPVQKDYTIQQTTLYWEDLSLPENVSDVTFSGCYPKPTGVSDGEFTFDLSTADNKDLLLSTPKTVTKGTSSAVDMTFTHAMHRLVINYTSDGTYTTEELAAITTSITGKSTCKVNLATSAITETPATTAVFTAKGNNTSTIMISQATADVNIAIEIGNQRIESTLSELLQKLNKPQTQLEGGKQLTLDLVLKRDGISLGGFVIEGWGDQGSASGEIII